MQTSQPPFVSVIIPVYNDSERLKMCLQALEQQSYPKDCYEVIVVDNGSDDHLEQMIETFSQVTVAYENQKGSYAARNKGLSLATGAVLAFTDSDCLPAHNWIEKGVTSLLRSPNCGLVGGSVELFFKIVERPTAVELYDSLTHLTQKFFIEKMKFSVTANLFSWKKVFDLVGAFDANLRSGGDKEWGQRVFSSGYPLIYAADVCVAHPARSSFAQLCKKERRLAGGSEDRIDWKKHLPPLTINYESIMDHLPPLPPVFKVMRYQKITMSTKMATIVLWFIMRFIRIHEKLRLRMASWG